MSKLRHPEKVNKEYNPIQKKPSWIRVKISNSSVFAETKKIIKDKNLVTVCEEAGCPNISECWSKKHATFMILGDTCTRACAFCNVKTGIPNKLDLDEPQKIANSVKELNLNHVVITSVDRDDLEDGGALHQYAIKARRPNYSRTIQILAQYTPNRNDVHFRAQRSA